MQNNVTIAKIVIGVIVGLWLLVNTFITIESWFVWVKYTLWKINYEELQPGLHFVFPIVSNVKRVNVRVKTVHYKWQREFADSQNEWVDNKPQINVLDIRGLPISIELTLLYQLKTEEASETIEKYWFSWDEKLVNPTLREVVRDVLWLYEAEKVPEKRQEIAVKIKEVITAKFKGSIVNLTDVQLRNVTLPTEVQEKIMQVQVAKQEAERQKYELEKAKIAAQTVIVNAEAQANAKIEKAKWDAESTKLNAIAQAEANIKISKSITETLIKYKFIEVWDWILPKVSGSNWSLLQIPASMFGK